MNLPQPDTTYLVGEDLVKCELRLPRDLRSKMDCIAGEEGLSRNHLLVLILRAYIDACDKKVPEK